MVGGLGGFKPLVDMNRAYATNPPLPVVHVCDLSNLEMKGTVGYIVVLSCVQYWVDMLYVDYQPKSYHRVPLCFAE